MPTSLNRSRSWKLSGPALLLAITRVSCRVVPGGTKSSSIGMLTSQRLAAEVSLNTALAGRVMSCLYIVPTYTVASALADKPVMVATAVMFVGIITSNEADKPSESVAEMDIAVESGVMRDNVMADDKPSMVADAAMSTSCGVATPNVAEDDKPSMVADVVMPTSCGVATPKFASDDRPTSVPDSATLEDCISRVPNCNEDDRSDIVAVVSILVLEMD